MIETEAILEKIVERLKANLTNVRQVSRSIAVMVDERVPPGSGEEFIGVYLNESTNINPPPHPTKRMAFGFTVGITRRMEGVPNEMAGNTVLTYNETLISRLKPSMVKRAKEIAGIIEENNGWALLNEINPIFAAEGGTFVVPFGLSSISPTPRKVDEDHFDIDGGDQMGIRYVGLLLEIEFAGGEYFLVTS